MAAPILRLLYDRPVCKIVDRIVLRPQSPRMGLAILLGLLWTMALSTGAALAQADSGIATAGPATLNPLSGQIFLPQVRSGDVVVDSAGCPLASGGVYGTVPVLGAPPNRAAVQNPDINLAMRGYVPIAGGNHLVDIGGATDVLAPQLAGIFADHRAPVFTATYRVYDWDWPCGPDGCKGGPIHTPPVTLVALQSQPQEPIGFPTRGSQIYNGGYIALVLYAEATRITITYTREDNPAIGYLAHLEDFCVDPNLLALYQHLDDQGRNILPALRPQDLVGTAAHLPVKVAIRDTGSFMDPRSRKDWWVGY